MSPSPLYMQFRHLPEDCRPAWLVRHLGVTVLVMDRRTTCVEMVEWVADRLIDEEKNHARRAYDQPDVGLPLEDWWMTDRLVPQVIPEGLRMPGAQSAVIEESRQARRRAARLQARAARQRERETG